MERPTASINSAAGPSRGASGSQPGFKTVRLRNVDVNFPFQPYPVQMLLMERVIKALQTSTNSLLESPTGTGKTLSLLCSTRAWQESYRSSTTLAEATSAASSSTQQYPTIIYASRTHQQLEQVSRELGRTPYKCNAMILGSRENACAHPDVSRLRGRDQIHACKELIDHKACTYRDRASYEARRNQAIPDIEDIANAARSGSYCSYYFVRDVLSNAIPEKQANIIFMPYNYLVDASARRGITIPWNNAVVVIDEAHNIEDVCEEAFSFSIDRSTVLGSYEELDILLQKAKATGGRLIKHNLDDEDLRMLRTLMKELHDAFDRLVKSNVGVQKGSALFDLLSSVKITVKTYPVLRTKLEECSDALGSKGRNFDMLCKAIVRVFDLAGEELDEGIARAAANDFYRLMMDTSTSGTGGWRVNYWCFSPGVVMRDLQRRGVRSILIASGTLNPLDSFAKTLRIPFPVRAELPHVVPVDNVWLGVIPTGVTKQKLTSTFGHRERPEYQKELGNTLIALARLIPDGMLVFFPSYSVLASCVKSWNQTGIWPRLAATKKAVIVEERGTNAGVEYDRVLEEGGSAMLLAVCRGKASEGIDFRDHRARGVVLVGIPFPANQEPRVIHKRLFLDESRQRNPELLSGDEWYTQQGFRAVNQAIGRAIRHEKDYGAIVLLDERFATTVKHLSLWLRPSFKVYDTGVDAAIRSLAAFFRTMKALPQPTRTMMSSTSTRLNTGSRGDDSLVSSSASTKSSVPNSGSVMKDRPNPPAANASASAPARKSMSAAEERLWARSIGAGPMLVNITNGAPPRNPSADVASDSIAGSSKPIVRSAGSSIGAAKTNIHKPSIQLPQASSSDSLVREAKMANHAKRTRVGPTGGDQDPSRGRSIFRAADAKKYLMDCKSILGEQGYEELKDILRSYKAFDNQKSAPLVNQRVLHLFSRIPDFALRQQLIGTLANCLAPAHETSLRRDAGL